MGSTPIIGSKTKLPNPKCGGKMSVHNKLSFRFPLIPQQIIGRIIEAAQTRAINDFDVYAVSLPTANRVNAAIELKDRLSKKLCDLKCINKCSRTDCTIRAGVFRVIEEEIDLLIDQISQEV
jgi:hypothetical protein